MSATNVWVKRIGHTYSNKLILILLRMFPLKLWIVNCVRSLNIPHLQFQISCIKSKECFELIHYDTQRRFRNPSLGGCYFLTIVDDSSRSAWIFLLKHKFEIGNRMINCHKMIKTQFGKLDKGISCDNEGEFIST